MTTDRRVIYAPLAVITYASMTLYNSASNCCPVHAFVSHLTFTIHSHSRRLTVQTTSFARESGASISRCLLLGEI